MFYFCVYSFAKLCLVMYSDRYFLFFFLFFFSFFFFLFLSFFRFFFFFFVFFLILFEYSAKWQFFFGLMSYHIHPKD